MTIPTSTLESLRGLQKLIGRANAEKGFHDEGKQIRRFPQSVAGIHIPEVVQAIINPFIKLFPAIERNYWTARLSLLTTEVAEGIEELRNGRAVDETWYTTPVGLRDLEGDLLPRKPEGVPSELADVVIRALDFAEEAGIDLAAMIDEKLTYNATRAKMHGRKF